MDVGALTYVYPGASGANTTEVYLGAGYGPVSAKYSQTVSTGYFGLGKEFLPGEGRGTGYLNLAYTQEVMSKMTLKASVGLTHFKSGANAAGLPDYALVGATRKASYLYPAVVDASGRSINRNTLVVLLTKTL